MSTKKKKPKSKNLKVNSHPHKNHSKITKSAKFTKCMFQNSRDVFFLRSPKRRRQAHRPRGGGRDPKTVSNGDFE